MAKLTSPGVAVSVTDESAYGSGSQGTVPLIILATQSNKASIGATGYAAGTIPANASQPYLLTSQRELVETFGAPHFEVVDGTPIHASEVNEYGLMAAYSYLGLANRAYVLRADVDLGQLEPTIYEPAGAPANGTYWLDLTKTVWGVKVWRNGAWTSVTPLLPTQDEVSEINVPLQSFGNNGDFAVVLYSAGIHTNPINTLFIKVNGAWSVVTPDEARMVYIQPHYKLGTLVPSTANDGDVWIQSTSPNKGINIVVKKYNATSAQWLLQSVPCYGSDEDANDAYAGALTAGDMYVKVQWGIRVVFNLRIYNGTAWNDLASANSYEARLTAPVGATPNGTLWYNANLHADLYVKANNKWEPVSGSVTIDPSAPVGASANDIWVNSSDMENYPRIFVYNGDSWVERDVTDQHTPNGVVFADLTATARDTSNDGGASAIDENAPDPEFFPEGILLWNSIVSTGNVKRYDSSMGVWSTYSGNYDSGPRAGAPYMLRKAQRRAVVKAMQAAVNSNTKIREETVYFTLIAAPGYPELLDEMTELNVDRKETGFVIVDTPLRLAPGAQNLIDWASGVNAGVNGEDGIISAPSTAAAYYPSAITSDLSGNDIVVPASHVVLRTYAYNDQVSYPWFAPAGLTRGVVTNAANVGYVNSEGEFVSVALTGGQRDTLYANRLNPISNFPGQGLYVFGQKTLQSHASALDRVNVSRLLAYLRERFDPLARPFIFEPNDQITRTNAKSVFDAFLSDMISKRAIYDFIVVCDETNNTPGRIDANELWIDVAIEPTKAAEFIYIPIRVVNTGALAASN
jgi:hypothetical protein